MITDRDESENFQHRKRQLEIMLQAQDHHGEIIRIAREAPDRDALVRSIEALLEVSEGYAHMVRLMSVERFTSSYERRRIVDELEEVTALLGE